MTDFTKEYRHLTKRVALEKDTITYRLASRELGITVSKAKELLASYLLTSTAIEREVTATYVVSGILKSTSMQVDSDAEEEEEPIQRRSIRLCPAASLSDVQELYTTPSTHIYAIHSTPLPTPQDGLILSPLALPIVRQTSAANKWKSPAPEGGFGGIVHPDGERRKKGKDAVVKLGGAGGGGGGGAKASTSKAATTEKKSTAAAATTTTTTGKKVTVPALKIGERRGLFAKPAPPLKPEKVIPTKRKASPEKPKKAATKKSNGLFDDEMDSDDEALWGDDADEEAMREAEEEATREAERKQKGGSVGGATKVEKGKGKATETKKEREERELKAMMEDDDDDDAMIIDDPPAPKPKAKVAPAAAPAAKAKAAPAPVKKPAAPKQQGNLNSFFGKK